MSLPTAPVELTRAELPLPTYVDQYFPGAGAVTFTVPGDAQWVLFAPAGGVAYVRVGGAAAEITVGVDGGTGTFPLPAESPRLLFNCRGISSFSLFSNDSVGLAWYRDHTSPIT